MKTESSIQHQDPRLQDQFQKASTMLRAGNAGYAQELGGTWVAKFPNVPEFRMLLREAQLRLAYPDKQYQHAQTSWSTGLLGWFGAADKDAIKALNKCEHRLAQEPLDIRANEALANVAKRLNWKRTEVFALQTLLLHPKRTPDHVLRLANLLASMDQVEHAAKVCKTFLSVFPTHRGIQELRNQLSITQSMEKVDS